LVFFNSLSLSFTVLSSFSKFSLAYFRNSLIWGHVIRRVHPAWIHVVEPEPSAPTSAPTKPPEPRRREIPPSPRHELHRKLCGNAQNINIYLVGTYKFQKVINIVLRSKFYFSNCTTRYSQNSSVALRRVALARRGRMGGFGLGPGGECVCPRCGYTLSHIRGKPSYTVKCPRCGSAMTRARWSYFHIC